jgi:prolyl-tRNA editing enzyme YbaK/EbsC (Cys-tRNA(Pro) deacylase)
VLSAVRSALLAAGVPFREVEHPPTYTSEESARARGESLHTGAKALVMKIDDTFRLFVLPADRKVDSGAIKREFKAKKIRFATPDELRELTGLAPGSVPPFGKPILPLELIADTAIGQVSDKVAFNAGSLTVSIIMAAADWERVAQPRRCALT